MKCKPCGKPASAQDRTGVDYADDTSACLACRAKHLPACEVCGDTGSTLVHEEDRVRCITCTKKLGRD